MHANSLRVPSPAILVLGLYAATAWAAGPDPGINVTVTNPPTQPVPVTGSLGVSGSVTGSSGTVTVSNPTSLPVPVITLNPEGVAFMIAKDLISMGGYRVIVATVPAGRRYLVEHASASCSTGPSDKLAVMAVGVQSAAGTIRHFLVPTFLGQNLSNPPVGYLAASTPIKFEAGPGTSLTAEASPIGGLGVATNLSCNFTLSGRSFAD